MPTTMVGMYELIIPAAIAATCFIWASRIGRQQEEAKRIIAKENEERAIAIRHAEVMTARQVAQEQERRQVYPEVEKAERQADVLVQVKIGQLNVFLNHAKEMGIADAELLQHAQNAKKLCLKAGMTRVWREF